LTICYKKGEKFMLWPLKRILYRAFSYFMKIGVKFIFFPSPTLYTGPGSVKKMPEAVKSKKIDNVLVVTDKDLMGLGLLNGMLKSLEENDIKYTVFDGVQPNPTIQNVEDGVDLYLKNDCQGIILFGGGSPMDCGKIIAARVKRPNKSVKSFRGLLKILRFLPPMFAVPTTAGTGSEVTIAAIITNPETHEKLVIADPSVIPGFAFLDSELMAGLPPHITAGTGMDALTHAVEAYIGLHDVSDVRIHAEKATRMIFENLEAVYKDGSDLVRRDKLALASYYAGYAFTRASVGYVHAIAHNLGGLYGVPHGLANAIILPHILRLSRKDAEKKLAKLAIEAGIGFYGETEEELSFRFIHAVEAMNKNMGIPETVNELKREDIPLIAKRALKEANPMYPVPTLMNQETCEDLVLKLLPA
jgi:alcohol dehydrogenase class IV